MSYEEVEDAAEKADNIALLCHIHMRRRIHVLSLSCRDVRHRFVNTSSSSYEMYPPPHMT